MCYWSVEHADVQTVDAVVGQELRTRRHYAKVNWIVTPDLKTPVCLKDGTELIAQVSRSMQREYDLPSEAEVIFRTREEIRMDLFCFKAGAKMPLDALPHGLTLTVISIPGASPISPEDEVVIEALREEAPVHV